MMDKENIERIKAYYFGEMSSSERLAFEADLENNSELKKEYLIYNTMQSELKAMVQIKEVLKDPKLKEEINNIDNAKQGIIENQKSATTEMIKDVIYGRKNDDYKKNNPTDRNANRNIFLYIIGAAALIPLLIIFSISLVKTNPDKLYEHYYSQAEIEIFHTRGIQDIFSNELMQAYNLYASEDYKNAEVILNGISDSTGTYFMINFLKALIEIEKENYAAAIELIKVELNPGFFLYEERLWYFGLCYLKTKNIKEARRVFTVLKETPGKYQADSRKLVRKIKSKK